MNHDRATKNKNPKERTGWIINGKIDISFQEIKEYIKNKRIEIQRHKERIRKKDAKKIIEKANISKYYNNQEYQVKTIGLMDKLNKMKKRKNTKNLKNINKIKNQTIKTKTSRI